MIYTLENDSLKVQNPIEEMEEDTEVNLGFDKLPRRRAVVDSDKGRGRISLAGR